jgi:SSS family solute:Na+ symporter
VCVIVTVTVSLMTKPLPEKQLEGLVYGCTKLPSEEAVPWFLRPVFWAIVIGLGFVVLNVVFW